MTPTTLTRMKAVLAEAQAADHALDTNVPALRDALETALTALDAVHGCLSGLEWNADTPADVADVLRDLGYTILEPGETEEEAHVG